MRTPIITFLLACASTTALASTQEAVEVLELDAADGVLVYSARPIPEGVALSGEQRSARQFGYRIPSLLTTANGTLLAFVERRLGMHDHAQNDIVVKRSADGGRTWGEEQVVHEDGMNSINDPLTVQLSSGRILMMFARFPYGRHARTSGWIKMAETGYDDPTKHVLTFLSASDDDGRTWSLPRNITRQVKPAHWINANSPGAMIEIQGGPHAGRLITALWGTVPPATGGGARTWQILAAYSDDGGESWERTEPLEDTQAGFANECQIAEASNHDLVLVARNQDGVKLRKKAISRDGGATWTPVEVDPTLPSVACMGSIVRGPAEGSGEWSLFASFPSDSGRVDGRIAVSRDRGQSFEVRAVVRGSFAYSATQVSPDGLSLLCLYERPNEKELRLLSIPIAELERSR